MATYILLSRFTDQGIRHVKDTGKRAEAVRYEFRGREHDLTWPRAEALAPGDAETISRAFVEAIAEIPPVRQKVGKRSPG